MHRLIDANALRKKAIWGKIRQGTVYETDAKVVTTGAIDTAPTVDAVEVVHGRWETANDGTHFCSRCGCDAPYTWDEIDRNFINSADDVPDRPSNYCPNCGAKMDGERINNDRNN